MNAGDLPERAFDNLRSFAGGTVAALAASVIPTVLE